MNCSAKVSFWMMLVASFCVPFICNGQQAVTGQASPPRNSIQFLESSSPLPGGGRVVSKSSLGNSSTTTVDTGQEQLQLNGAQNQSSNQSALRPQVGQNTGGQTNGSATRGYAYPAAAIPTTSVQNGNTGAPALATYPAFRARKSSAEAAGYFAPTLGITPRNSAAKIAEPFGGNATVARTTARVAQNCNCACQPTAGNQQSNLRVQGFSVPSLANDAASTAPSLTIQDPQAAQQFNPGTLQQGGLDLQTPGIGVPQFNNRSQTWTPFATGSGAYQPLIRLANMQPGTYLGQGVIGQPTAYVDGQPVRNLLRYFFP